MDDKNEVAKIYQIALSVRKPVRIMNAMLKSPHLYKPEAHLNMVVAGLDSNDHCRLSAGNYGSTILMHLFMSSDNNEEMKAFDKLYCLLYDLIGAGLIEEIPTITELEKTQALLNI